MRHVLCILQSRVIYAYIVIHNDRYFPTEITIVHILICLPVASGLCKYGKYVVTSEDSLNVHSLRLRFPTYGKIVRI